MINTNNRLRAILLLSSGVVINTFAGGADINARDGYGSTALLRAIPTDDQDAIELLLYRGANPNLADWCGNTAVKLAVERGEASVLELLLRNGASLTNCTMALERAVRSDREDLVELLLRYGANVSKNPMSLFIAVAKGNSAIVDLLLRYGVRCTGPCVLTSALKNDRLDIACLLVRAWRHQKKELLNLMLQKAASKDDCGAVSCALGAGADVNAKDAAGKTALILAAQHTSPAVARLLVYNGARPNMCDKDGETALSVALKNDREDTVELLVSCGAK